ncbi:hypothetical protein [Inhella gelatinilytica]|uniref:Uncharacterized protein n=1 Tax=Inhella gelatinilytica TaxID=2795030 RepID=A0A931IU03_9BURK|nr:hypothetical protein [Inhella gelatinilytica]MBH9551501.1 hypothetical protein [Inhella gelatinilytica]
MKFHKALGWTALFLVGVGGVVAGLVRPDRTDAAIVISAATCDVRAPQVPLKIQDVAGQFSDLDANEVNALLMAKMSGTFQAQTSGNWILTGRLDQALLKKWQAAAASRAPARLLISSAGGDEAVALQLAADLQRWRTPVIVFGLCGSACANYLLPAAHSIRLSGPVLLHGSARDCQDRLGAWQAWFRLGSSGAAALREASTRQDQFDAQHPQLRDLTRLSAHPSRGDPTGQPHDWLVVPASALRARLPQLEIDPSYPQRLATLLTLHQAMPELGALYAPSRLPPP